MAAYPLARFNFRGREAIYTFFTFGLLSLSREKKDTIIRQPELGIWSFLGHWTLVIEISLGIWVFG